MRIYLFALLVTSTSLWLTSCGGDVSLPGVKEHPQSIGPDGGPDPEVLSESSVANFAATLYPIVSTNCGGCHSEAAPTNIRQSPFFAERTGSDAILKAYDALLNSHKINFQFPAESRIVDKLATTHHNCWPSISNCTQNAADVLAAIQEWKRRDNLTNQTFTGTKTVAVRVPDGLTTTLQTFEIPLENLNTSLIPSGSKLLMSIRLLNGSYILSNPRVILARPPQGSDYGVSLGSWVFFLNSNEATPDASEYRILTTSILTNNIPTSILYLNNPLPDLSIASVDGPNRDTIQLGVRTVGSQSAAEIRFRNFKQVIGNCAGCHNAEVPLNIGMAGERVVPAGFADFQRSIDFSNDSDLAGPALIVPRDPNGSWLFQTLIKDNNAYPVNLRPSTSLYVDLHSMPKNGPTMGTNFSDTSDPLRIVYDFIMGL